MSTSRATVYLAIDSEREYQDKRWLGPDRDHFADHTVDEFILYISGYTNDLVHLGSHVDQKEEKLNFIRKVGALCVAAMEQHGAPYR